MASSMKLKRDNLLKDIRNWLCPPDPWKNHNIALGSRHEGTAMWFVQGEPFLEWKSSRPSSLLWIHGKIGAGKSVLCSTIIEDIDAMKKCGLASLAFFYHDYRDDQKRDLRGLLSSVLVQFCDQSDSYYDILAEFYSTHRDGAQHPSDNALIRCLEDILKLPGEVPIYLIVDALDECSDASPMPSSRVMVLTLVEDLINLQLPNLRICVTSRPEVDIKTVLEPLTFRSISLHDASGQMGDIENYIKSVIGRDRKNRGWTVQDKQMVIDNLTRNANGMFRWVYFQMLHLRGCHPGRIQQALTELPETLDETYERTLREIKKANWELAHRLFQCVTVASRPLRVKELAEFLAFDFSAAPTPRFIEEWRLEDPIIAIQSTCPSFLIVIDIGSSQYIQFSHFSIREYLTSSRLAEANQGISRYHVSMTPAHTLVAKACLGTLLHLDHSVTRDSLPKFPLAEYAGKHWTHHAQFRGVSQNIEEGMKCLFDPKKPHFAVWIWLYDPADPFWTPNIREERPSHPSGTPLHYATLCGLHTVVMSLVIEHTEAVLSRGFGDFSTPLHVAYTRGLVEVACTLLENGADESAQDWHGWSPLHLALSEGRVEFARILLEHGTGSMAPEENNSTPLHRVSSEGNMELTRLFLEHGVGTTALDRHGLSPLYLASGGHLEFARILLEYGAGATTHDRYGWTPLHLASSGGHTELVRILLQYGADVTAQDKNDWTSLHRASSRGHTDIVRILLEHGADADARDNESYSPLHRASQIGHVEAVRVLLDHGADMDAKDHSDWTSLHVASKYGHLEVVQVLLERGANAHALDYGGWSPLQLPSQKGNIDIVRILLKHGVDANTRDNSNWTPLHGASRQGHPEVVRVLLEYGADPNIRDNSNWTPLHRVSQQGHVDVARLLLQHGAEPNALDESNQTPFHLASRRGYLEIVQLLVKYGADIHVRNEKDRTSFRLAKCGSEKDLRSVLELRNMIEGESLHGAALHGRRSRKWC